MLAGRLYFYLLPELLALLALKQAWKPVRAFCWQTEQCRGEEELMPGSKDIEAGSELLAFSWEQKLFEENEAESLV